MKEHEFSPLEYDWKWDDTKQVLRVTKREPTKAEWVTRVLEHCNRDREICISSIGRCVYVCDNAGHMAKARCAITDTFDKNTGVAIAYARLRHLPIHSAFEPKTDSKQRLIPIYDKLEVKKGSRVYCKDVDYWGTVVKTSPAEDSLVTIKFDGFKSNNTVLKSMISLAVTGES